MTYDHTVSNLLQVRTERGVLPEDHPERVATRLGLAISAVEREDISAATSILEAYMDDEEDRITKVCRILPAGRNSALKGSEQYSPSALSEEHYCCCGSED